MVLIIYGTCYKITLIVTPHVQDVALYTDFKLDESYTPTRISVRVGTNFNDLQEIEVKY